MKEFWQQCEGQIIDGFPLEQYLGGDDSAVFLTHRGPDSSEKAAIKLIHADAENTESQLGRWRLASELTHPNLLCLYERGRWQLSNVPLLYVVMEYADENLAQVLRERPLTAEEAREMMEPALRALAFLHASGYMHGRLKPSNFLAVGNVLKLSSDGAREMGAGATPADDVWAFGVTLVEALTQKAPDLSGADLGATFPPELRDIAQNALRRDPRDRWTVAQIQQRLSPQRSRARRQVFAVAAGIVILLAAMVAGTRLIHKGAEAPVVSPQPAPVTPPVEQSPAPKQSPPPARSSGSDVIHEVMPDVLARARNSIHGKVDVDVRVEVNAAGDVQRAALESRGPSKYFADAALKAAERWKFAPTSGSEAWILRFEFTRAGTKITHHRASS